MIFVLDKIKIVSDKIFFVLNKKFCTWIKSSSLVMNCMKNDFLASDKNDFVQNNFHFVLDKNNFVWADGQGKRGVYKSLRDPSHLLKSFWLIENMYKTFLEYVYFFRILKLVQNLLRICIKPSESTYKNFLEYVHFLCLLSKGS